MAKQGKVNTLEVDSMQANVSSSTVPSTKGSLSKVPSNGQDSDEATSAPNLLAQLDEVDLSHDINVLL